MRGRLWSAPEAIRCEQGVFFAIFHFCMCPLGRQRARPSKAPQVEHISGIGGHWCQVIVFRRIGRLLNPSRRYYNIFVRLSRHFWVFFRQYCCFLPVMMSSGDRASQRCAQLTSRSRYVLGVHTSVPDISWTRRITPLGLGIPWPPCWRFGTIPNHWLTWRPCHSQTRGVSATPKRYVGHI